MEMLSALDATFIYLESEHSPMAIGAVYVIDAKDAPAGFSYRSWHALVKSRLKLSRVFRQRLVEVPLDLSFPYWVRDPGFELDEHLPRVSLAEPGGMTELMQLAADTWGQVLPRERPLWDITFVTGVNSVPGISKNSFALITRVHHAAVDGKASTEMMTALLDVSPVIRTVDGEDDWQPEALPSNLDVIARSWSKAGKKALELAGFVGKVAVETAQIAKREAAEENRAATQVIERPTDDIQPAHPVTKNVLGKEF